MRRNMPDFTGKMVLLSGGSSGVGRATAQAFAQAGANVAAGDIRDESAGR